MEIVGIGTEIVECVRIAKMIEQHGEVFLDRVFTPREIRRCRSNRRSTESFAAAWAAKEAVLKALGISSVRGLVWTELEIYSTKGERAVVRIQGAIKERVAKKGISDILVTSAHCRAYATAYAIACKG